MKNMGLMVLSIWQRRELIRFLVMGDFKAMYKTKAFGYVWSVLDPLCMMGVYYLLVSVIFKRGGPHFPLLLFVALLFWKCFASSLSDSVTSISARSQLVHSINFPKFVLPLSKVILNHLELLFGLLVLVIILAILHIRISVTVFWFPILLATQFFLTLGLAFCCSLTGVFFHDFKNILQYILRIGFYLSPILYSIVDRIPERFLFLYMLNPFSILLESYKNIFVWGKPISFFVLWPLLMSFIFFLLGVKVFKYFEPQISKNV